VDGAIEKGDDVLFIGVICCCPVVIIDVGAAVSESSSKFGELR
jgi:hypothetical protein